MSLYNNLICLYKLNQFLCLYKINLATYYMSLIPSTSFSFLSLDRPKNTRNVDHPGRRWGHSAIVHNNRMIIFGGRHSQRSLANLFALNLQFLTWTKLDSYGQTPPARDSHSVILYKNDMIIFGGSGSGKKLNDAWSFNFEHKKWTKVPFNNSSNVSSIPSPRDGHCVALVNNYYMMVYGGLDENEKDISTIHLFDLRNNIWILARNVGDEPKLRDSQSCTMINNTGFIFGGQGEDDERFNDMYQLNFDIDESMQKFDAVWSLEKTNGKKPPVRTSHSCIGYKNQFIFIIGGEGDNQVPLNDVWIYDIVKKEYSMLNIENANVFEGRFCHSTCLINDTIVIYGGMKNAEETLDNLTILCLDNKVKGSSSNGVSSHEDVEMKPVENNEDNTTLMKAVTSNKIMYKEISTDTDDLCEENKFNFEYIKQQSIDSLISFSFLKKMSKIYQWPFLPLGHFITNLYTHKKEINASSIFINKVKIEKKNTHYITVKDNGNGMSSQQFINIFSCYNKNDKGEYTFFNNGMSLKLSIIRLCNECLIISKTLTTVCVAMISNNLQVTIDNDSLIIPIVIFDIEEDNKFRIVNQFGLQSLNLILHEVDFLFHSKEDFYLYLKSLTTGIMFYLMDMKRLTKDIYELNFDETDNDIYYITKEKVIDSSFNIYNQYLFASTENQISIYINDKKLEVENPFSCIEDKKDDINIKKITSLNWEEPQVVDFFMINENGPRYNTIGLSGKGTWKKIKMIDTIEKGILIYNKDVLVGRLGSHKLGFIHHKEDKDFLINGYVNFHKDGIENKENSIFKMSYNKAEIVDHAAYASFYFKIKKFVKYLTQ